MGQPLGRVVVGGAYAAVGADSAHKDHLTVLIGTEQHFVARSRATFLKKKKKKED